MTRARTRSDEPGMGATVVLALLTAVVMVLLILRFHPGAYVPLLMPAILGWGMGTAVAAVERKRRGYADNRAMLLVVLLSLAAYGAYHLVIYDRVLSFLVERLPDMMDRVASNPRVEVLGWLDQYTGQSGALAYLTFVSEARGAELSPLGLLGRLEPGLMGTLIVLALEALLAPATAAGFLWIRCPGPASAGADSVREELARVEEETLLAALAAMDRTDFEEAGRCLAGDTVGGRFLIEVCYAPHGSEPWLVEIREMRPDATMLFRARRTVSSWDGQSLLDEFRMVRDAG